MAFATTLTAMNDCPQEGSFFAIIPRHSAWFTLSSKRNDRLIEDALRPVHQKWQADVRPINPRLEPFGAASAGAKGPRARKFVFGAGGLTIKAGVAPMLSTTPQPYFQTGTKDRSIVFSGHLSNLQELAAEVSGDTPGGRHSFTGSGWGEEDDDDVDIGGGTSLLTTTTLLKLYDNLGPGRELLFLSELQGQYAFMILDAHKKLVFAARDPTGEEELYYSLGDDGAISFTNSLRDLPSDVLQSHKWREVPPGHFVSGKDHTLSQFALTPEQLAERERHESGESLDDVHLFGEGSWEVDHTSSTPPTPSLLRRLSKPWS